MESSINTDSSEYSKPPPPAEDYYDDEQTLPTSGSVPAENIPIDSSTSKVFTPKSPSYSPPSDSSRPKSPSYSPPDDNVFVPKSPSYSPPSDSSRPKSPSYSPPDDNVFVPKSPSYSPPEEGELVPKSPSYSPPEEDAIDLESKNTTINKLKSVLDKKQKKQKNIDLYSDVLDTTKVVLKFKEINKDLKNIIEKKLKDKLEKKCNTNGYVKPHTLHVVNYSSGSLRGNNVEFTIVIQYKVCYPVEGMVVRAKVKNVTKAGIRAEISEKDEPTPLVIFIARDHHNNNDEFINIKENEFINAKIIGKRFELNDSYISVIAELAQTEQ
jgi:DNA-directed RNA polymerase subunit E'/Rpb7